MTLDVRDPRLTPARSDLAAVHLRGLVKAERFVAGEARRVVTGSAPLRKRPDHAAGYETEAVMGEPVTLYDAKDGFAFVQLGLDRYVGYLPEDALGPADPQPTHRVTALRTFLYPAANMKRPNVGHLSLGATFAAADREGDFLRVRPGAYIFAAHAGDVQYRQPDYCATAERLVGTPYLWGGRTSLGLDCSGLVQLSLLMAGMACPRDTDMQESALGEALPPDLDGLQRGDLVFWKGHVGLMLDADRLIHANGHHMSVAVEPLREAVERIAVKSFGAVTSIRRLSQTAE